MNGFEILNLITTATGSDTGAIAQTGELDLFQLLIESGTVVWIILGLLVGLSVACWYIIGFKYIQFKKTQKANGEFQEVFWKSKNMDSIQKTAQEMHDSTIASLFTAGYTELLRIKNDDVKTLRGADHSRAAGGTTNAVAGAGARAGAGAAADASVWNGTEDGNKFRPTDLSGGAALLNHAEAAEAAETIERSMKRAQTAEINKREKMIPLLGTTSSTAPFIGLFGTVWGIMDSFLNIGSQHSASLATVAPGIAEALITTAIGLAAAIPAVVAYNHYINRLRLLSMEMDSFNSDFINIVKRHFLR